jgi:transcription antitermination factor NusG
MGNSEAKPQWYVVKTNNRQEKLARFSLRSEGLEVYLPMIIKTNKRGETRSAPMFPNHLFVRVNPTVDVWPAVFAARGVSCVLGHPGPPTPIFGQAIERMKAAEIDDLVMLCPKPPLPKLGIKRGETVRVGPLEAIFQEQLDANRVLLLIRLLGDTPRLAKAALKDVERVAA